MPGTSYQLEINPQIPARIGRLSELANNLWYSWDSATRTLFTRLHPTLWQSVSQSPKAFLKRVDQYRLDAAAEDPVFLGSYNRVLSAYDTYMQDKRRQNGAQRLGKDDLVAYFCAEFGFHESLPIYSGGLGILAGDHCKAASDMRLPFVGVGLLYRQGYFFQSIDGEGRQHALYTDSDFDDLPITPVLDESGEALRFSVQLPGRTVHLKVWEVRIGHVRLVLLDSSLPENSPADQDIAHRLYGGDRNTRIEQEILLGVGGARALAFMGIKPTVWHINEGHAAFLVLERIRALTSGEGLEFAGALEAVAANTVFTTHTAVPAGHDHFSMEMIQRYFESWCGEMKVDMGTLLGLGRTHNNPEFNMTALAVRGSRFHNGVSQIHGDVSSDILSHLWPEIEPADNPVDYVTNGVHQPTFLARDWNETFEKYLGHGWSQRLTDEACWAGVQTIPDQTFWSIRQSLKAQMLQMVRERLTEQHLRNQGSEAHLDRILRLADPANPHVLTIGFARRFATYKRATLLFHNLDWLRRIVSDSKHPVLFIFAGKAHPADQPGQELIRRIAEVSRMPEFEGHVLLIEGYDLRLARRLVAGVDVWLNNPIYPLEASGTSGMKAAFNGVLNLSVADGWWGEGYDGRNGWTVKPASNALDPARRDDEDARSLYELLEKAVVPLYYDRGPMGYSPGWIGMSKRAISTLLPKFNTARMVGEYMNKFYMPATEQWHRFRADGFAGARELAAWKSRVRTSWSGVRLRRLDAQQRRIPFGSPVVLELAAQLNGLSPEDVVVECLFGRPADDRPRRSRRYTLEHTGRTEHGEHLYRLELTPDVCGKIEYQFRVFPHHGLLTHPFEMGMMVWL